MVLPVLKEPSKPTSKPTQNKKNHLAQKRPLKASNPTINLAKFNGAVCESTLKDSSILSARGRIKKLQLKMITWKVLFIFVLFGCWLVCLFFKEK